MTECSGGCGREMCVDCRDNGDCSCLEEEPEEEPEEEEDDDSQPNPTESDARSEEPSEERGSGEPDEAGDTQAGTAQDDTEIHPDSVGETPLLS